MTCISDFKLTLGVIFVIVFPIATYWLGMFFQRCLDQHR